MLMDFMVTEVTTVPMVMGGMARGTLMKPLLNLVPILMLMLMVFMVTEVTTVPTVMGGMARGTLMMRLSLDQTLMPMPSHIGVTGEDIDMATLTMAGTTGENNLTSSSIGSL